jgi:hypothetical protein
VGRYRAYSIRSRIIMQTNDDDGANVDEIKASLFFKIRAGAGGFHRHKRAFSLQSFKCPICTEQ